MNVRSRDGTRIDYDVAGTGPAILLLHGFSHDRSMWSRAGWVERLGREFTVVTLDLRGCGTSEKPELSLAYSLDAHLTDIDAVLSEVGVARPIVWGWSLGATIALHHAKTRNAAATIAAGTYFGAIFTAAYVDARRSEARSALQRARWDRLSSWPAVEPDEVRGPLLVFTGTRDGNVVGELRRQRSSIDAADDATLHVFEGLNHLELITAIDIVCRVVEPFIRAAANRDDR